MEGGSCACVMFIRKYPNGLTDQFLNELTNMDFPIIYSMDVEPLDNDVAYQMVMKKYMSNERSINREQELKNENGDYSTNINYERRKQQRDTEEMLDRISSFDERLLYVGITIVVKAASMEELEERTEKVRIIGKTHNMDIVPHSYRQLDALNTSLPTEQDLLIQCGQLPLRNFPFSFRLMCRRFMMIWDTAMALIRYPKI